MPANGGDYGQFLAMHGGAEPIGTYPFGCLACKESCLNAGKSFTQALGNPEDPARKGCRVNEIRSFVCENPCKTCENCDASNGVPEFMALYDPRADVATH